jgi:hypothetical protein
VYEGDVTIRIRFASPPTEDEIRLSVTFQPCDDAACLAPVTRLLRVATHP